MPSNGLGTRVLTDGAAQLDTASTGSLVINTDTGEIRRASGEVIRAAGQGDGAGSQIYFRVVMQTGGPPIGVFSFARLQVAAGTAIRARGRNALALAAADEIRIDGLLDLTGGSQACFTGLSRVDDAQCFGPGGGLGGANDATAPGGGGGGGGEGGPQGFAESGGGGGGHLTAGGLGGEGLSTTRGAAGPVFGSATLEPLTGGGGGGGGGDEPQTGARGATGGGGGGAVQIVSNTSIRLVASTGCGINAGGGGAGPSFSSSAGGGGGAGGGILLEAPEVSLESGCGLAANGGGGSGAHFGTAGGIGQLSTMAAQGSIEGSNGQRNAGNGGDGGASTAPEPGENGNDEAGGAGGGVGAVRVNTLDGTRFTGGGMICPQPTEGAVRLE